LQRFRRDRPVRRPGLRVVVVVRRPVGVLVERRRLVLVVQLVVG
jgi:hypothetical protein